jgi:tetratricopeptide (TPR) repeat protein
MMKIITVILALGALALLQTARPANAREQLKQYVDQLQKSPNDDALRNKLIQLALTLRPRPVTPDLALEALGKGKYLANHAASVADFTASAAAFAQASLLAPWVPDYYFNQGILLEKAGRYEDAIKALRWYLTAAPDANDKADILVRIGGLQAAADKAAEEQRAAADKQRQEEYQRQAQEEAKEKLARQEQANAANGFWRDPSTGLMWTKRDTQDQVNWNMAANYCRNLHLAGYTDWRLPTIDELQGIFDPGSNSPTTQAYMLVKTVHVKGNLSLSEPLEWSSSSICQPEDAHPGVPGAFFFFFGSSG